MSRILAIDYGGKRCGLAETDDLQIAASRLQAVPTAELLPFCKSYIEKHNVDLVVLGEPFRASGAHSDIWTEIEKFAKTLKQAVPQIKIVFVDERFSSKMAMESMIAAGVPKKKRSVKENLDIVSAVIILQDFLNNRASYE